MGGFVKWVESFWDGFDTERDLGHMRVSVDSGDVACEASLTERRKQERQRREKKLLTILDKIGFSWRVYAVAFLGFLATSWSLIAINIISPAL